MIEIRPIQSNQVEDARRIILSVAQRIFEPEKSYDEFAEIVDEEHVLDDMASMDSIRRIYFEHGGTFLVVLHDGKVIGTGAIKQIAPGMAEIKRLWLLEEYHGQKIGYRVMMQLLDLARQKNCTLVRLQTGEEQVRAIGFYERLGFYRIPNYNDEEGELSFELRLT